MFYGVIIANNRRFFMDKLLTSGKKKLTIDEIADMYRFEEYTSLVHFINKLQQEEILVPVKNSKSNGKNPPLFLSYRLLPQKQEKEKWLEELEYTINPVLNIDYYRNNIKAYLKDRGFIMAISQFLDHHKEQLSTMASLNERSFEIWGREKFLQKEGGKRILKNLSFDLSYLNIYETTEPLAYYSNHKNVPQTILMIENKDTFYSMRRHLINGNKTILQEEIGTLVYGAGKGIIKAFSDFEISVEPYMTKRENQLLYFGDLDYEGIRIYESLNQRFKKQSFQPFIKGYEAMLKKAEGFDLPDTKEGQNENIGTNFLDVFEEGTKEKIIEILQSKKYIPQEILNSRDF